MSVSQDALQLTRVSPARFEWHEYRAGGSTGAGRRYRLFVPGGRAPGRPAPLVVLLHGCTQDPDDLARGTRMNEVAERYGALVAYPEQPASANGMKCWNWFDRANQRRDEGEPALVAGITREVMRAYDVDAARVHIAGISAGAAMALLTAASYPELYASAASHSGMPLGVVGSSDAAWAMMRAGVPDGTDLVAGLRACGGSDERVVPLLVVHGAADNVVSVRNGRQTAEQWARAFDLAESGQRIRAGDDGRTIEETDFARAGAASEDVAMRLVVVADLGHAWSGGSRAGTFTDEAGPAASELMMAFFATHPMTGASAVA